MPPLIHHLQTTGDEPVNYIPALLGLSLWLGATAILCEDLFHSGHLTITHALQPVLTAGTVAAAVWVHKARWIAKPAFLVLALIGSLATLYGTMGRQATAKDDTEATIQATNRTYGDKTADLKAAKVEQAKECRTIGKRCEAWNARVDKLTGELSGIVVKSTDPRADAVARLVTLAGGNGGKAREIVAAFDPLLLPLFLEFGSIVFFAIAFPHRKREQSLTVAANSKETETVAPCVYTRDAALADFRRMRRVGSQQFLADRYGVDKSTVSRWLREWETEGYIARCRKGKQRTVLALPHP